MFWADKIVNDIEKKLKGKDLLVIRDEKTASGRMLISAMRGAVIHGILAEIFSEKGVPNEFLWEINDTDAFRSVPQNLKEEQYKEYLGMPLYALPSPGEGAENYPEFFAKEFTEVMNHMGFTPTYYRASIAYKEGKFNETIKTALENAELIREIYKKVSGSEKPADWLPLFVVCEKCGKVGTTKTVSFDGEKVKYTCEKDIVVWAEGCGHEGEVSPFDGNATLPWKVEWAAKFKVFNVDVEGGGKDLSTKGGARDVSNHIAREVFNHRPPFDIPYEFFLADGKKMSTSKGNAPAAFDIVSVLPSHIYRLVFLSKNYKQAIEFNLKGDTVPTLFDTYDRIAEKYWSDTKDDFTRLFELIHAPEERTAIPERFLPRFSQIAFLVQMSHMNVEDEVEKIKGEPLTEEDRKELENRMYYASRWLTEYAPEEFKFELQLDSVPENAKQFSDEQKKLLTKVREYIQTKDSLDGQELHTTLHEIRKSSDIDPKEFFSAVYLSFLGKESGPKAGWFLSVLDREFLEKRLLEVTK
jgi:lysyl-tRNA synthetase class 1|tara:strand:- start:5860 stop:7437 length:1578 start_codon:yes stop_codon:yes gene_type:complete